MAILRPSHGSSARFTTLDTTLDAAAGPSAPPASRITRPARFPLIAAALVALLASACSAQGNASNSNGPDCIENFDAGTDYFPDKVTFDDAVGVTVTYHKSYKTVVVKEPAKGAKTPVTYVLVQCGAPTPQLTGALAGATAVNVPTQTVASTSTTQIPAFEILDKIDVVAGMRSPNLLWPEGKAQKRFEAGKIVRFGNDSGGIDIEKVVAIKPDLFISSNGKEAAAEKIAEAGISVVVDSSWLEDTPLGRSEWIKYFALFVNAEKRATEEFDKISTNYREAAEQAKHVSNRPTVLLGGSTKGTWYRPHASNYVANFMKDAGADYVYANVPGNSTDPLDIEQIVATGAHAEFWLNGSTSKGWNTISDATKDDARYGRLAAVKNGNVWNPTKRIGPGGGNDYWQSGVVHPDVVLKDLIAIFHPELEPDHDFTYYRKLPPS